MLVDFFGNVFGQLVVHFRPKLAPEELQTQREVLVELALGLIRGSFALGDHFGSDASRMRLSGLVLRVFEVYFDDYDLRLVLELVLEDQEQFVQFRAEQNHRKNVLDALDEVVLLIPDLDLQSVVYRLRVRLDRFDVRSELQPLLALARRLRNQGLELFEISGFEQLLHQIFRVVVVNDLFQLRL